MSLNTLVFVPPFVLNATSFPLWPWEFSVPSQVDYSKKNLRNNDYILLSLSMQGFILQEGRQGKEEAEHWGLIPRARTESWS